MKNNVTIETALKKIENERGSITLFVLIAMIFFLTLAFTAYASSMTKLQGQNEDIERIKASYEQDLSEERLDQIYNEITGTREWLPGEGTEQNPYKIYTIEDLLDLSNRTNNGESFSGKYIEIINDLDFKDIKSYEKADRIDFGDVNGDGQIDTLKIELTTNAGWKPISRNSNNPFSGTILGNKCKIKNIYMNNNSNQAILGLIACAGICEIKDLNISGNITTSVEANVGGIVGAINSQNEKCNLQNCTNEVNIISASSSWSIGGLVGAVNKGMLVFVDCNNSGNISGSSNAGGILGYSNGEISIENCYNTGEITNLLGGYVGGFIGRDNATTNSILIENSYNKGQVTGKSAAGGIFGMLYGKMNINDSYNDGKIINSGGNGTGGIVGYTRSSADTTIEGCYNAGSISGNNYTGGIAGQNLRNS